MHYLATFSTVLRSSAFLFFCVFYAIMSQVWRCFRLSFPRCLLPRAVAEWLPKTLVPNLSLYPLC